MSRHDLFTILPLIMAAVLVGAGLIGGRLAASSEKAERTFSKIMRIAAAAMAALCAAAWLYQRDAWTTAVCAVAFAVFAIWPPRRTTTQRVAE